MPSKKKKKDKAEEKPEIEPRKDPFKTLPKKGIKKRTIFILVAAAALLVWLFVTLTKEEPPVLRTETVKSMDLVQEVSVTGSVKPAKTVSLGFEVSGKVSEIFAQVGDRVEEGDELISLGSTDLQAQLRQAQAGLASASALRQQYEAALAAQQAKLDEMKSGTRSEEIRIAETNVLNAQNTLDDAERNLDVVNSKADADLSSVYNNALLSMLEAVVSGKTALISLSNIQQTYFTFNDQDRFRIEDAMEEAVYYLLGERNAGSKTAEYISRLIGGVFGTVQNLGINATHANIDKALNDALFALQKVKFALDSVPIKQEFTTNDIAIIDGAKSTINSSLTTLSGHRNQISVQKATNQNMVYAAETQINQAENALNATKDQLNLVKAGYTDDQIRAQQALVDQAAANLASAWAQVNQAYANVQNYQAQLAKTVLYAPIAGLVTKMEAKVGEIVFPSSPYSDSRTTFVSIISDRDYEIEARVAEVDIAKIKIGDPSRVTLDAYGEDVDFEARVIAVDPAETIIESIPTYKVTLQFVDKDVQVKSGMTANLDIQTDMRAGVITVPQRAIISRDDKKFVRLLKQSEEPASPDDVMNDIVEVEVVPGLRGSDGRTEILDGLSPGDVIVVSIE